MAGEEEAGFDDCGIVVGVTAYDQLGERLARAALTAHQMLSWKRGIPGIRSYVDAEDEHGWNKLDHISLEAIHEVDLLGRLAVPSATAPVDERLALVDGLAAVRQALPFSDAERQWLFKEQDQHRIATGNPSLFTDAGYRESLRQREVRLMSDGIWRLVRGHDLMQRWCLWRRETGVYAGDPTAFQQTCDSLLGLAQLLEPK
jgi:hypothetical protein